MKLTRALLLLLGVPLFVMRPTGVGAILVHDHGSDGQHFHAVGGSGLSHVQDEHAEWHHREHGGHGRRPLAQAGSETHSEDCGSLLLVFGDNHSVRATPNGRTGWEPSSAEMVSEYTGAVLDFGSPFVTPIGPCPPGPPILRYNRIISNILLTNHSLLI